MALYDRRRRRNVMIMGLSVVATAFGAAWLVRDPWHAAVEGLRRPVARRLHRDDAAAGQRRRPAQRDRRQPDPDRLRHRDRHADRHPRRHLHGRIRRGIRGSPRSSASSTTFCCRRRRSSSACSSTRSWSCAMGHFSGWAGAVALAMIVMPVVVRTTEDMLRLVAEPLREAAAALGAPRWQIIRRSRLSRRARRHRHRRAARHRAHQRRDGAAAVHRAQQPVLEPRPQRADGEPAGRHLPVRAERPMTTGSSSPGPVRCIITFAVLALNIVRALLSSRPGKSPK